MKHFQIDDSGKEYAIRVDEVVELGADLVRTLIDIDLQTFAESTFSHYTAAAFLKYGHVFLLHADKGIIGTCVCMRTWDRPNEALILSMGIKPGWRGRGLGQFFISGVVDRLREQGHLAVCLLVGSGNARALKVYKDVGFDVIDEGPEDPRTGERFVYMRLGLPQDGKLVSIQGGGEAS
jgi:GNAT superfamily N-acetyltransferase